MLTQVATTSTTSMSITESNTHILTRSITQNSEYTRFFLNSNSVLYPLKISTFHLRALKFYKAEFTYQITATTDNKRGVQPKWCIQQSGWVAISEAKCYTSAVRCKKQRGWVVTSRANATPAPCGVRNSEGGLLRHEQTATPAPCSGAFQRSNLLARISCMETKKFRISITKTSHLMVHVENKIYFFSSGNHTNAYKCDVWEEKQSCLLQQAVNK